MFIVQENEGKSKQKAGQRWLPGKKFLKFCLNIANGDLAEGCVGLDGDGTNGFFTGLTIDVDVTKAGGSIQLDLILSGDENGQLAEAAVGFYGAGGGDGFHTGKIHGVIAEAGVDMSGAKKGNGNELLFFAEGSVDAEGFLFQLEVIGGLTVMGQRNVGLFGALEAIHQNAEAEDHQNDGEDQFASQGERKNLPKVQQEIATEEDAAQTDEGKFAEKPGTAKEYQGCGPKKIPKRNVIGEDLAEDHLEANSQHQQRKGKRAVSA